METPEAMEDTREVIQEQTNNIDIENRIIQLLQDVGNADVHKSIGILFGNEEQETIDKTIDRVLKEIKNTDRIALVSSFNTASMKEQFRNEYQPHDVQLALAALKDKGKIMQLGRGRGRGIVLFKTQEGKKQEEETVDTTQYAQRVDEVDYTAEEQQENQKEVAATDTSDEVQEESHKEEDELEILEDAMDTIYKLFQRKRIEMDEAAKSMEDLQSEIVRLEKQVSKLEEEQTSIELTTWR